LLTAAQSDAPATHGLQLAEVPVAFCDSIEALDRAYAAGLSPRARIVTFSPAVAGAGRPAVSVATPYPGHDAMLEFHETVRDTIRDLYSRTLQAGLGEGIALQVGRETLGFQHRIFLAAHLRPEDAAAPRAFISPATGIAALDRQTRPIWQDLFADCPTALFLTLPVAPTAERHHDGGALPPLLERLRLGGWERLAYRGLLKLWSSASFLPHRGTVGILHESELVKETACHLGLRGFRLVALPRPTPDTAPLSTKLGHQLNEIVDPPMRARIAAIVPAPFIDLTLDLFRRQLHAEVAAYAHGLPRWRQALDRAIPTGKPAALLTNYPAGGDIIRLAELCAERRMPFAAFQHGLNREFQEAHSSREVGFENNVADTFFAFNAASAQISAGNPFARKGGRVLTVGLPRDYSRAAAPRRRRMAEAPILFVSTMLYRGHYQQMTDPVSDVALAAEETSLVETLARLPHRVHYKPYPALRYTDPDQVLARVRAAPNMRIVGTDTDLRYLMARYRMLICNRATNTIAWCLMSRLPFVFIDPPGYYRLRDAVREDFRAATFYIDTTAPDWRTELHSMLSRPIDALEQDWQSKLPALEALIRSKVTVAPHGAGRRAADAIEALLIESRNSPNAA